jgi:hypothetical protein
MFFELYLVTFSISIGLALIAILTSPKSDRENKNILPEFDYEYNSDSGPEYTNQNYYRNRLFDSDSDSLH